MFPQSIVDEIVMSKMLRIWLIQIFARPKKHESHGPHIFLVPNEMLL